MNSRESAIQVKGKTLEAALQTASSMLGVPESSIRYEEKKKGFLGSVFSNRVEILAWLGDAVPQENGRQAASGRPSRANAPQKSRNPRRKLAISGARSERSTTPVEPLTEEQLKSIEVELCEYLLTLSKAIVDSSVSLNTRFDDQYGFQRLIMDIDESEFAQMILDNSKLRESLEHLIRKKPRHLKRELPFRIFIDGYGQRQAYEAELRQLADDLSQQAVRDDKPVVLDSQSAYDRKIIHMALDKNQLVYTKSVGMGAKRKLMIIPNNKPTNVQVHQ